MRTIIIKNAAVFLATVLCLCSIHAFSQGFTHSGLFRKFISNKKDTVRRSSFFPFPTGSISPETGLEYGVAAMYSFYTDKKDANTRVSTINILGTHTTKNQTGLKLVSDIWSKQNKYHYYEEFRYRNYPYSFYGIGGNTVAADKDGVDEKRARLAFAADKKILNHYYIGIQAAFEDYVERDKNPAGLLTTGNYYGNTGGKQIYFGIEQLYDSRNNVTYTTKGWYGNLLIAYTPDFFGGNNFHGAFVNFDGRYFTPVSSKITLGINGIYQGIYAKNIPFYLLPQMGSMNMMRGYYQGRFRDKDLAAMQAELRYRFIPRLAVAAFGGYGTVWGENDFSFNILKPEYGLGIRYFFDLGKDLSIRFDYGIGQKLPGEKRMSGFYFSMMEAF